VLFTCTATVGLGLLVERVVEQLARGQDGDELLGEPAVDEDERHPAHGVGAVVTDVGGLALPGSCNSFR